jgi:hypothetical protein
MEINDLREVRLWSRSTRTDRRRFSSSPLAADLLSQFQRTTSAQALSMNRIPHLYGSATHFLFGGRARLPPSRDFFAELIKDSAEGGSSASTPHSDCFAFLCALRVLCVKLKKSSRKGRQGREVEDGGTGDPEHNRSA